MSSLSVIDASKSELNTLTEQFELCYKPPNDNFPSSMEERSNQNIKIGNKEL